MKINVHMPQKSIRKCTLDVHFSPLDKSGGFRGVQGGSIEPICAAKSCYFHGEMLYDIRQTNPVSEFESPFQKSWIRPCLLFCFFLDSSVVGCVCIDNVVLLQRFNTVLRRGKKKACS